MKTSGRCGSVDWAGTHILYATTQRSRDLTCDHVLHGFPPSLSSGCPVKLKGEKAPKNNLKEKKKGMWNWTWLDTIRKLHGVSVVFALTQRWWSHIQSQCHSDLTIGVNLQECPGGNFITSGKNIHLDLRLAWLEFGGGEYLFIKSSLRTVYYRRLYGRGCELPIDWLATAVSSVSCGCTFWPHFLQWVREHSSLALYWIGPGYCVR